jgi:hypothetical protein
MIGWNLYPQGDRRRQQRANQPDACIHGANQKGGNWASRRLGDSATGGALDHFPELPNRQIA